MEEVSSQSKRDSKAFTPVYDSFPVPSPVGSTWTEHLKTLVQNAGFDRGNVEVDASDSSSSSNSDDSNKDDLVSILRKKEILSDEALFKKLKNNIAARSKLSSIHAARAHKYGHVQFGPKNGTKSQLIFRKNWRLKRIEGNSARA